MKKGWATKTLGEVLQKTETVNPLQSPETEFDYIDVSSVSNATFKIEETQRLKGKDAPSRARKLVRANDILFATIRPTLQRIAVVPEHLDKQVCSTGYFVFRPKPGIDHRFVFYSLLTENFMGQMESLQRGASYPAVTDGDVKAQMIPVPPLPEQQRIVGILDEAFGGIATAKANAEKNLQNAHALFESRLQSVFTQHGKGWKATMLGEEVDLLAGFAFKSIQYTNVDDDIRLLRGDNIIQGCLRWDDVKRWPATDSEDYDRYQLREGDVVLAMDRPWVNVGLKYATISADDVPCLLVQRTARLRGGANLDNRFLKLLIGSSAFISHILGVQTGIGVPHISGQQIKDFEFARPPIADQRRIADNLESLREETQRLASLYERKLAAMEALRRSLLHQAFAGQI
jgi:type I restriction enzyme S subunit